MMMIRKIMPLVVAVALTGCVPAIIGGGVYAASKATSERGIGGAASDVQIQTRINKKWWDADADLVKRLDLTVNEGRVLITGVARDEDQKLNAAKLAWEVEGVSEVQNDVTTTESTTTGSVAKDTWISTKLRSILLFDNDVASRNYTVQTTNTVVYLMGYARNQRELDRVTSHASTVSGVTKVISYVRVGNEPDEPPAQP